MKKLTIIVLSCLFVISVAVAEIVPERVVRKSERVNRMVKDYVYDLNQEELRQVDRKFTEIRRILEGQGGEPEPGVNRVSGECHIDDDTFFDYNENVVGTIKARSAKELSVECRKIAEMTYGNNSSSGLKKVRPLGIDRYTQIAECHIDNDSFFDFNEIVIGKIAGKSARSILKECKFVAQVTYGNNSSAGIKKLNRGKAVPSSLNSGVCHIDNDTFFDYNEFIIGTVWGRTYSDLLKECKEIAYLIFGNNSSGGIKNTSL